MHGGRNCDVVAKVLTWPAWCVFDVAVLAGEMLKVSLPFFERNIHPTIICQGYMRALEDSLKIMDEIATEIDPEDNTLLNQVGTTPLVTFIKV